MALILNIDTATEYASLALSNGGNTLSVKKNKEVKDHASWIHHAIRELLEECRFSLSELEAIAITEGPGSYTGLRVGMATAKGLCYVLDIPLIVENTLKVMARAYIEASDSQALLVPMIDARRMEVYTAIYDSDLAEVMPPAAMVLVPGSFEEVKAGNRLICFGTGSQKFQSIVRPGEFEFDNLEYGAGALGYLAYQKYMEKAFADLAYAEPLYLKEFYSPAKK